MIVVSDTTAVTTLVKAGLEEILSRLFGRVFIPEEVGRELLAFHPALPDACEIRRVTPGELLTDLADVIDPGEAEAIALSVELQASILLIDDRKGRRQAEALGLTCLALPAVLTAARRAEIIPSLKEAFERIDSLGNYRVTGAAAKVLLESVEEG